MTKTTRPNTTHESSLQILHRDDLQLGGFAGLKEHRLVQDSRAWGRYRDPDTWEGIESLVYLADARFVPHGETGMHPHHEVDVISVMVEGRIAHQGSLEDGQVLVAPQVQVQRAGGDGFEHNEVNPDATTNRMIQLWILPDEQGQSADYRVYDPTPGQVTRVFGGSNPEESLTSRTSLDIAMLNRNQTTTFDGAFLAYLAKGRAMANGVEIKDGDLIRGNGATINALEDIQLIVAQSTEGD